MIDIHDPKGSAYTTWSSTKQRLDPGTSYHIPLGMCRNGRISNLGVAGRCASSTHEGASSVRIQTHCLAMGQGLGTCAAMAIQGGISMAQVPIRQLQEALRRDGVYLEDVPPFP